MNNFWNLLPRPILALAPMVGVTDSAFRQRALFWGAHVVYSEMISADAIVRKAPKALAMLRHADAEYPLVIQLMGRDSKILGEAAREATRSGAHGIDINFGCPAHKIARNFCGAMLMREFALSRSLIESVLNATPLPVSIKMRVSINAVSNDKSFGQRTCITIGEFLEYMKDLPIAALMVHGRSFEDPFEGGIRADMITQAKRVFVTGPVIANGGITSVESSKLLLEATRADGIGFARSAIGRPWIFKQVADYLATGVYSEIPWDRVKSEIVNHAELFNALRGRIPFKEIRKHLTKYVKGHTEASLIRNKLTLSDSTEDVARVLQSF